MIWEHKEFNYSEASQISEWLMERPGTIQFPPSMVVIKKPPNTIRILVVVGYEPVEELYYTMMPASEFEEATIEGTEGNP